MNQHTCRVHLGKSIENANFILEMKVTRLHIINIDFRLDGISTVEQRYNGRSSCNWLM